MNLNFSGGLYIGLGSSDVSFSLCNVKENGTFCLLGAFYNLLISVIFALQNGFYFSPKKLIWNRCQKLQGRILYNIFDFGESRISDLCFLSGTQILFILIPLKIFTFCFGIISNLYCFSILAYWLRKCHMQILIIITIHLFMLWATTVSCSMF